MRTVKDAGEVLLKALSEAHYSVLDGFSEEEMFVCGSTTLLGGILLP
jgi:hypothetical protein